MASPSSSSHASSADIVKSTTQKPYHLYTIRFSHYCEKARWALELFNIPYQEHVYLPIFHTFPLLHVTRLQGKKEPDSSPASTPALIIPTHEATIPWFSTKPYTEYSVLCDSFDIVKFISEHYAQNNVNDLYHHAEVVELEQYFATMLGPHARRAAYFDLLQDTNALNNTVYYNFPQSTYWSYKASACAYKFLMKKALGVTEERSKQSRQIVREVFHKISERLADGRSYLCGDRFSAADLSFAALGSVVCGITHADGYGAYLPSLDEVMESEYKSLCLEMTATPAGQFIHRMYREARPKKAQLIPTLPAVYSE